MSNCITLFAEWRNSSARLSADCVLMPAGFEIREVAENDQLFATFGAHTLEADFDDDNVFCWRCKKDGKILYNADDFCAWVLTYCGDCDVVLTQRTPVFFPACRILTPCCKHSMFVSEQNDGVRVRCINNECAEVFEVDLKKMRWLEGSERPQYDDAPKECDAIKLRSNWYNSTRGLMWFDCLRETGLKLSGDAIALMRFPDLIGFGFRLSWSMPDMAWHGTYDNGFPGTDPRGCHSLTSSLKTEGDLWRWVFSCCKYGGTPLIIVHEGKPVRIDECVFPTENKWPGNGRFDRAPINEDEGDDKKRAPQEGAVFFGMGSDAPMTTNADGGKQSHIPYRCDLLPPMALMSVAEVLDFGAKKYGADNWKRIPTRDHINHAMAHLLAFLGQDTSDKHLQHAACRILMALELDIVEEMNGNAPSC